MLTHLGKAGDTLLSANSVANLVTVHAVKQANGKTAILLINKDPNNIANITVGLNGTTSSGSAAVYTHGENSTAITSSTKSVSGSSFTVALAPYSLTTINLP
jgi:alpha-L-arabinofuranosidase